MRAYRKLLGETLLMMGVDESRTYVVMEEVKQENKVLVKLTLAARFATIGGREPPL